jgi:hypothetical protein
MPDYDLSGLSSRSFEKLIQAIAGKVLGPGTITFGDGPDGGREATFEGRMDYPSKTDPWEGYCVIQAKFLQRPKGTGSDIRWSLKQLEGELKAFADPKKHRRRPEYYIFVTNVILTPVQERGGKDKAVTLLQRYRKKVPLRGWAIWDFDEIGKFLDTFAGIRCAYAAWITPGDVLSEVMKHLATSRQDFLEVMTNFLAKELRSDQFVNLEQAGHRTEDRIPLGRVFVDLPTTTQRTAEPPREEGGERSQVTELVAALIERAKDTLDPASIQRGQLTPEGRPTRAEGPQPGRYVLVGGPGQGKTTVSQFACQLFRVALLQGRPSHLLSPEVQDILSNLREQCRDGVLSVPTARRFPVRIALSELADALNKDADLSLLAFIAHQMTRRTGRTVSSDDVRSWLSSYPWFIALDGLDEVPPSTNRQNLLKKIEDVWIDAAQVNADVLVLATTRPQGYSDDFSPAYYRHLWLAPLSPGRAMAYAQRLVEVRYGGEPERQQKILTRLEVASKQGATARLMRSPLQVTIMAALVDQTGNPPQDRWRLFHDYYEVIYGREREREIPAAELLRDHKPNIDAVHQHVGLVLQVESEQAGGAEAKLPADRFGGLVTARLEEEGFSGPALANLRDRIIDTAANRLVFLVGLEEGQVGFEIRSLQEYMAAEAIMTGSQDRVQERLRCFAPVATWRNVFLFAAGRCFSQEQHLRDTIHTICVELNDQLGGPVGRATLAGSVLAIDLLEDGVARRQPKYARLLAQCAALLLELPPAEIHGRLADVCEGDVEVILRENLEERLAVQPTNSLAAWATLLPLVGRGFHWSSESANRFWPQDPRQQLSILSLPTATRAAAWVDSRVEGVIKKNSPYEVWDLIQLHRREGLQFYHIPYLRRLYDESLDQIFFEIPDWKALLALIPTEVAREFVSDVNVEGGDTHPGWLPTKEMVRFARSPSKESLAEGLRRLAETWQELAGVLPYCLPVSWVFGSCLASARSSAELVRLAERAAKGELGDLAEWLAAERRWKQMGVKLEDFLCLTTDRWPFDREIERRGFPIEGVIEMSHGSSDPVGMLEWVTRLDEVPRVLGCLAWMFIDALGMLADRELPATISPELVGRLVRLDESTHFPLDIALLLAEWALHDERWLEVLDEIGKTKTHFYSHRTRERDLPALPILCAKHSARTGLLRMIAANLQQGPAPARRRLPVVRFEQYDDPKIRWAALLIELAREGFDRERAGELAATTGILRSLGVAVLWGALSVIARYERFDDATDHYLVELLRYLSGADWEDRSRCIVALNDSMRRRSSGVTERGIWRSLALPEKLLDLVAKSVSQPV